jgi:biopolymer transport protein ExbD
MKKLGSLSGGDESSEVNISPLIDMVFILLIFFIVTTVFVEETGVDVDKPEAASAIDLESNSIMIAITRDGEVVYGSQNIGVTGVRAIVTRLTQKEKTPVIIQVDEGAGAGLVVRVIDEAKLGGAETISLSADLPAS